MDKKNDVLVILQYQIDYLRDMDLISKKQTIEDIQYVVDNLDDVVDMINDNLIDKGER